MSMIAASRAERHFVLIHQRAAFGQQRADGMAFRPSGWLAETLENARDLGNVAHGFVSMSLERLAQFTICGELPAASGREPRPSPARRGKISAN